MTLLCLFLCLSLNAVLSSCTFGTKTLQQFDDCTTLCDVLGGVLGGHSEDSCPPKCSEWIDVPLFNHNTLSLIRNLQVFTGQLHMCLIMGFVDQGNFAGSAGFQTITA